MHPAWLVVCPVISCWCVSPYIQSVCVFCMAAGPCRPARPPAGCCSWRGSGCPPSERFHTGRTRAGISHLKTRTLQLCWPIQTGQQKMNDITENRERYICTGWAKKSVTTLKSRGDTVFSMRAKIKVIQDRLYSDKLCVKKLSRYLQWFCRQRKT